MKEVGDPAIKLFGKTIALTFSDGGGGGDEHKFNMCNKETIAAETEQQEHNSSDDQDDKNNNPDDEKSLLLKKPDKILPCPRCNSMDTKFCYYNNYNVNQPRHFCKNCQRYWTAGGTMRNVPVGAGRRKNKNNYHYRHISVSDTPKPNATVLSFGTPEPAVPVGPTLVYPWPVYPVPMYPWGYPVLGKHVREEKDENAPPKLWMPKTLRIHDPEEAAKSSVWATLGLKRSDTDIFRGFDDKGKMGRSHFCANPAAMSRSVNFQESS